MSWLTEFDDDDNEIEDPWKALDQFCANKDEFHVWTDMGMRLRKTAKSLLRIYLLSTDQGARTEALATLLEIGMPPPMREQVEAGSTIHKFHPLGPVPYVECTDKDGNPYLAKVSVSEGAPEMD